MGIGGKNGDDGGDSTQGGILQVDRLTPEQQELLRALNIQLSGEIGQGIEPFPGEVFAPEDELQTTAFDAFAALGTGARQGEIDSALSRILAGQPAFERTPETNAELQEFYQTAFVDPSRAQFQDTLDEVAQYYSVRGLERSGGFLGTLADRAVEHETNLQGQLAQLVRGDVVDERQSREAAAQRVLPGVEAAGREELRVPGAQLNAGTLRRSIQNELNSEELFDWQTGLPAYNPWLGYLNVALGVPAFQFGSQGPDNSGSQNTQALLSIAGLLGGAIGGGG